MLSLGGGSIASLYLVVVVLSGVQSVALGFFSYYIAFISIYIATRTVGMISSQHNLQASFSLISVVAGPLLGKTAGRDQPHSEQ